MVARRCYGQQYRRARIWHLGTHTSWQYAVSTDFCVADSDFWDTGGMPVLVLGSTKVSGSVGETGAAIVSWSLTSTFGIARTASSIN